MNNNYKLEFSLSLDETCYVVIGCEFIDDNDCNIIIPTSYNGLPVKAIAGDAFYGCETLKSIVIPETIVAIGDWAFSECISLTSIEIPSSVKTIGKWTFNECVNLKNVFLHDGLVSIDYGAFIDCNSLESIFIPRSVDNIEESCFDRLPSLVSIDVDGDNLNFCSHNGVLFTKDLKTIINYPAMKKENSYCVPESVNVISSGAFYGCKKLTEIILPKNLKMICGGAFNNCLSLKSINIPKEIKKIEGMTFYNCKALVQLEIPSNIKEIGEDAFLLSGIKKIIYESDDQTDLLNKVLPTIELIKKE